MKKTIAILLAAVMLLSLLAACSSKTDTPAEEPVNTETPAEEPVKEETPAEEPAEEETPA